MVIYCFKYRCKVNVQLRKILKAEGIKEDLNFLTFGVSDHLTSDVDTVGLVEDIEAEMVCKPGISDLFHGSETQLNDVLDLFTADLFHVRVTPGTRLMTSSTSIWQ